MTAPHDPQPSNRYRTPHSVVLDQLMRRVSAASNFLELDDTTTYLTELLLDTPLIWPLDDQLLEMLLELAGFDLADTSHLDLAVSHLCFLHGTGLTDIVCGHDRDPSPLCVRASRLDDHEAFISGTQLNDQRKLDAHSTRALAQHQAQVVATADHT